MASSAGCVEFTRNIDGDDDISYILDAKTRDPHLGVYGTLGPIAVMATSELAKRFEKVKETGNPLDVFDDSPEARLAARKVFSNDEFVALGAWILADKIGVPNDREVVTAYCRTSAYIVPELDVAATSRVRLLPYDIDEMQRRWAAETAHSGAAA